MTEIPFFLHFDVESVGLHGEGFAVGGVVHNAAGQIVAPGFCFACHPDAAEGDDNSREWISENVPALFYGCASPLEVRAKFWDVWMHWKAVGAVLVSDCGWPVESRFLIDCVKDFLQEREWDGPYPFYDLASVLLAQGKNPLASSPRIDGEMPQHDPLADARQSARLFIEAMGLK